ncbi:hypothetical protein NDU88_004343 [Pleurodeles waltl]|uniref:Uncharacterized protein n=1 Tax=Pleurodeles waltl TaxID=8319 RepID=A0AAV7SII0_PLEWA|nr:hypothetical protein NDU88_004343 [Pleurodeles waltl]
MTTGADVVFRVPRICFLKRSDQTLRPCFGGRASDGIVFGESSTMGVFSRSPILSRCVRFLGCFTYPSDARPPKHGRSVWSDLFKKQIRGTRKPMSAPVVVESENGLRVVRR